MLRYFAIIFLFLSACGKAEAPLPADRSGLIAEFANVVGIEQMIVTSKEETQKSVAAQGEIVVGNLRKAGLSDDAVAQVRVLYNDVMKQVLNSWTPQEASRIYTEAIAESMSDDDLKKSVSFYRTDEGRRTVTAAGAATGRLQLYIQGAMTNSMRTALATFTDKMQAVVAADRQKRATATPAPPTHSQ